MKYSFLSLQPFKVLQSFVFGFTRFFLLRKRIDIDMSVSNVLTVPEAAMLYYPGLTRQTRQTWVHILVTTVYITDINIRHACTHF